MDGKSSPARIIGIDPGTGITGFGIIDKQGPKQVLIDAGVIRTPANSPQSQRLLTIYKNLSEIAEEFKPTIMSIEKLFFTSNITTAMTVSEARGVALLVAEQNKMEVVEYTPLQIKSALTGYGKAEKHQVQEMVKTILKLKEIPKPDDCADALAAAICHSMRST